MLELKRCCLVTCHVIASEKTPSNTSCWRGKTCCARHRPTCSRFVSCGTTPVHHCVIYGGEEPGMSAMGHGRDSSTHSIHRCREKRESSPFQRSVLTFHGDIVFNKRTLLGRGKARLTTSPHSSALRRSCAHQQ